MIGFAIAGVVALVILGRVVAQAKTKAQPAFGELVEEARALGLDGHSIESGMSGTWEGMSVEVQLGSHRLRRVGTAGSTRVKMIVVTCRGANLGSWWIAAPNLASRTADTLPQLAEPESCAGGGLLVCAAADSVTQPWAKSDVMDLCKRVGLELAVADQTKLELKFSPYPPGDLDTAGRVKALLNCAAALSKAA